MSHRRNDRKVPFKSNGRELEDRRCAVEDVEIDVEQVKLDIVCLWAVRVKRVISP